MSKTGTIGKQSLHSLGTFGYLTSRQLAKLLYGATSPEWETHLRYVQRTLHAQVAEELVIALPGRVVMMPNIYTLSGKGYSAAGALGMPKRRVRPSEEADKAHNLFFREHTMAVTEVLIAAHLLAQTQPGIQLTRLYTERELKRKIFVRLPERTVCLEPDASLEFLLQEEWQDFFTLSSTAICRLRHGASSKRFTATSRMPKPGSMKRCFRHPRFLLPLLPKRPRWQKRSNAGLRKRLRRLGSRNRASGFSSAVVIWHWQARLSYSLPRSGSSRSVPPKRRFLFVRSRHNGIRSQEGFPCMIRWQW
jgi:Replication-relaxation